MTIDATLVARLESCATSIGPGDFDDFCELLREAAARITTLEVENAALRERMAWRRIETAPKSPHKPWTPAEREAEADFQSALRGVAPVTEPEA